MTPEKGNQRDGKSVGGKHSPRRLRVAERRAEAWRLRRHERLSFEEIGERLGCSKSQAARDIQAVATQAADALQDRAEEALVSDLDVLDDMQAAIQADANAGDLDVIAMVLKVIAQRQKLLSPAPAGGPSVQVGVQVNNQNPNALTGEALVEMTARFEALVREVMPTVNEIAAANPGEVHDENETGGRDWPAPPNLEKSE